MRNHGGPCATRASAEAAEPPPVLTRTYRAPSQAAAAPLMAQDAAGLAPHGYRIVGQAWTGSSATGTVIVLAVLVAVAGFLLLGSLGLLVGAVVGAIAGAVKPRSGALTVTYQR